MNLVEILDKHSLYLQNKEGGEKANLSRANLSRANLSRASLSEANLSWADLSEANLSGANLSWTNLSWADLSEANLSGADLSRASLSEANLSWADLSRANLSGANLSWANLSGANLSGANLSGANLSGANLSKANLFEAKLSGTNLSNVTGLLHPKDFLKQFERTLEGFIVYKAFNNTTFNPNSNWKIEVNSYIEETVNSNRTDMCGCGVNFATLSWCKFNYENSVYWKCLLEFEDLCTLVVPYNTDGKARCGRLKLLEIVT